MGRIVAPYGVQGWVKIQPFTERLDSLFDYEHWWIGKSGDWKKVDIDNARKQGNIIIAKFANCMDRDNAFTLKGKDIAVPRSDMPATEENEYYWSDLIGLKVHNLQQIDLGEIKNVFATGANDVLVVQAERERLIPFIDQVVKDVNLDDQRMLVDWDADY